MVCEYAAFNPAFANVCGGICGAGLMLIETKPEPVTAALSVTCAVNDAGPTAVGVPVIAPFFVFRVSPAGKDPFVIAQLTYGGVPPLAASDPEYGRLTVHAGRLALTTGRFGPIASEKLAFAVAPSESVATTETVTVVPAALSGGVPLSVVPFSESQEGNDGAVQVTPPVPPVAASDVEYCWFGVAGGSGDVVVIVTGGLTTTLNCCAGLVAPVESVTVAENPYVVCVVTVGAVPVRFGPFNASHAGNPIPVQLSEPVPPVSVSVCE
jgi:hypothetical protein